MLKTPKTPSLRSTKLERILRVREVNAGVVRLELDTQGRAYRSILKITTDDIGSPSIEDQLQDEGFQSFLAALTFPIQILIHSRPYDSFKPLHERQQAREEIAALVNDYIAFLEKETVLPAVVKREIYLIVPTDRTHAKKFVKAQAQLDERTEVITTQLSHIGLRAYCLTDEEVIALYFDCLQSEEGRSSLQEDQKSIQENSDEQNEDIQENGQKKKRKRKQKAASTHRSATKNNVLAQLPLTGIETSPWHVRLDYEKGHEYIRVLTCMNYPQHMKFGWLSTLLQQIQEPYIDVSIHIRPLASSQVERQLQKKAKDLRTTMLVAQRQGKTTNTHVEATQREIEHLSVLVERDVEQTLGIALLLRVHAPKRQELEKRHQHIVNFFHKLNIRILPAHWQHHAGLLSCLPEATNMIEQERLFSASATSVLYPFTKNTVNGEMGEGVLFGREANGNLLFVDPFEKNIMSNANLFALGVPDSGKSFFTRTAASRLVSSTALYIVDTGADYQQLSERASGQYIHLTAKSLRINPLELAVYSIAHNKQQARLFQEKLLHIVTLCELLMSENGSLSQKEKAFLYRCLVKTYELYGITQDTRTHTKQAPGMKDLYMVMSSSQRGDKRFDVGSDKFGLSTRLEPHLHLFPHHSEMTPNGYCTIVGTSKLPISLKTVGQFLATEFLWTALQQHTLTNASPDNALLLIDEVQFLMQSPQSASFLIELAKSSSHFQAGLWCTTQYVSNMLYSQEGKALLELASMKLLLKQEKSVVDAVVEQFQLKPKQREALLRARRGIGLLGTQDWKMMQVIASAQEIALGNDDGAAEEAMSRLVANAKSMSRLENEGVARQRV